MDQREVNVDCPCCRSRLEVDVRSGKVVKWRPEAQLDETGKPKLTEQDWTGAEDRVKSRMAQAADKFDQHLSGEKSRERDLDELFKKASDKLRQREPDEPDEPGEFKR